jgi:hypothetical protein
VAPAGPEGTGPAVGSARLSEAALRAKRQNSDAEVLQSADQGDATVKVVLGDRIQQLHSRQSAPARAVRLPGLRESLSSVIERHLAPDPIVEMTTLSLA